MFLPVINCFAQLGSGQSQVNLIIIQALSIEVAQPSVSIDMAQTSHFLNGSASGQQSNHVQVVATTGYEVSVKSVTEFFSFSGNSTTLPVSTIAVQTQTGSDLTGSNSAPPAGLQVVPQVMLSTSATPVATCTSGEGGRGFHVNYAIPTTQTPKFLNRNPGTYTTTIVYTLLPQ